MKLLGKIVSWVLAVLFILSGLATTFTAPIAGICYIAIGLLFLPPLRQALFTKTNFQLKTGLRIGLTVILLFVGGYFIQASISADMEEYSAGQQKKNMDVFSEQREAIISDLRALLAQESYADLIERSRPYVAANDEELNTLIEKANAGLTKLKTKERTDVLVAEVKKVPAEEFEKNKDIYAELLKLNPSNQTFKNKLALYESKLEAQNAVENRTKMIERQFSGWDGSHNNLVKAVKKNMNDPDSFDHAETRYVDKGDHLIVQMDYRGKNGFGGVVLNSIIVKTSLNGQILQVIDQ